MKKVSIELTNVKKFVILAAKPAAGKGWLCKNVFLDHLNLDFDLIETGQMLRDFSNGADPMSRKVSETMKAGNPVDNDLVIHIVFKALEKCQKEMIVLDGFPRTDIQFKIMDRINIGGDFAGIVIDRSNEWVITKAAERSIETGRSDRGLDKRIHLFTDETRPGMEKLVRTKQMPLFQTRRDIDLLEEAVDMNKFFNLQNFRKKEVITT